MAKTQRKKRYEALLICKTSRETRKINCTRFSGSSPAIDIGSDSSDDSGPWYNITATASNGSHSNILLLA